MRQCGGKPGAVAIERAFNAGLLVRHEMDEGERALAGELVSTGPSLGRGECEAIAEEEGLDKADVARQMLVRSVRGYRLERAIRRYREGEITMARAAEDTGLSLYDMIDELARRGLGPGIHYTPEEMREYLARLLAEVRQSG